MYDSLFVTVRAGGRAKHNIDTTRRKERDNKFKGHPRSKQNFKHSQRTKTMSSIPSSKQPLSSGGVEELHPSWIASKRRKEMERTINKPQGQRIVFKDSDED